jgi:hypothetical protein
MTMSDLKAIDGPGVLDALKAIRAEAHRLEQPGMGYPLVSVRQLAERLGFGDLVPEILAACAEGGFTYCLDRTIEATSYSNGVERTERPSQDVCYWYPDQLRSRLDCVDYRIYR